MDGEGCGGAPLPKIKPNATASLAGVGKLPASVGRRRGPAGGG